MDAPRRYRSFVDDSSRWAAVGLRDGDIVISTPPKCGTTWMQMLCALSVFGTADLPAPLAALSPWVDMLTRPMEEVAADLDAQTHRRFMKTHTPLDGLPFDARVTYIHVGRDPRDVALSWDNHMSNVDMGRFFEIRLGAVGADDLEELGMAALPAPPAEDPRERFWEWIERAPSKNDLSGLPHLVDHVATFWARRDEPNVHLFHYADLRADLPGQMRRLAAILGVPQPTDELVVAATFERMKERADVLAPNTDTPFWNDTARFFDRARSGGWRDLLDGDDTARYERAVADLASPDLVSWLHNGWLGSELADATS